MDPKNKTKKVFGKLSAIKRDNKGLEARVLIYVLAAIVLVTIIGLVGSVVTQTKEVTKYAAQIGIYNLQSSMDTTQGQTPKPAAPVIT